MSSEGDDQLHLVSKDTAFKPLVLRKSKTFSHLKARGLTNRSFARPRIVHKPSRSTNLWRGLVVRRVAARSGRRVFWTVTTRGSGESATRRRELFSIAQANCESVGSAMK